MNIEQTESEILNTGTEPLLSVKDLKTYFFTDEGTVKAVDGASFDVQSGTTLGIVGESGCGKSITAKSILQIIDSPGRIVDGEVNFNPNGEASRNLLEMKPNGSDIRSVRGGDISMIFQEPMTSFSPVHTFGNQIIEAIRLHSSLEIKEAHDLAVDWMSRVGIPNPEQRMSEYAYQFSGGQRQRAMIAMALCTDPKLLIADEPTTALDVTTQAQILDLLQSLQKQNGMSIMFITHDLGVIAEIADTVAVMYLGRVVEVGPVETIFSSPKHPYTKALLSSVPTVYAAPRERLPSITGAIPHPQNRPSGCAFHPRCSSYMSEICSVKEPELLSVGTDQQASCFLYGRD
ncbi:MAG: ABC transporter ATP-binding protein [Pirellulaceae bacterium]|nr:ABC transporter ATP-binding protein [Pirellulaceae bacterium]